MIINKVDAIQFVYDAAKLDQNFIKKLSQEDRIICLKALDCISSPNESIETEAKGNFE